MTTKAQLTQLAERVIALSGPDREVDGLIFKALNPDRDWFKFSDCWCARCPDDAAAFDTPEHFTASLDAAMSLVPEGWEFMMEGDATPLHYPVETEWSYRVELGQHIKGEAATLALAITAAALLARAAECGE
jgi:hypothetical protein